MQHTLDMILNRCLFALLAVTATEMLVTDRTSAAEPPNVIWIMAEDIGTDLECYGMPAVKTPNLNRLAAEGAKYTRAYCAAPICSTSRSSMMVGVDQTTINAQHHRSNRDVPLLAPYQPITSYLRDAGYTCVLGFQPVLKHGNKIDCNFKYEPIGPWDGKQKFGLFDKAAPVTADDQPFFNQLTLNVTHRGDWWENVRRESGHPVAVEDVVLPPFLADTPEIRLDWANYLDTIEKMDDEIGLLMQELRDKGLDNNTVVIFIGDNGRCNLRGKGYLQETGIHIPLIIWSPGFVKPGTVVDELVCMTDISATVLQLAGAEIPEYMKSKPILGTDKPLYRKFVRSARDIWDEIDDCSRCITTKQFSYIKNHMPKEPWDAGQAYQELNRPALHVMRTLKAEGKLTASEGVFFEDHKSEEELYDLAKDPDQLNNLASDPEYAETLKRMRSLENDWQRENRDFGLEDLGNRSPEQGLGAVVVREAVKQKAPDLWKRLEAGELMNTQSWNKYARSDNPKKKSVADKKSQPNKKPRKMQVSE